MLYIFDRDEKVVGFLQSNSDRNKNIYYDDVLTEILSSGADSFAFTAISDRDTSKNLIVGNYIAFKKGNKFKLMQIMEVNESRENVLTKEIYCEGAGLELINTVYSGSKMSSVNIEKFLKNILQDTDWKVGYIDSNLTKTLSLEVEEKEVYSIIQEYLYDFEAEIDFRVEIKGNIITGRYIDVYSKRGKNNGRRLEINRDIKSISRKVSLTEYATKLIGEGKNGLNFRDISMSGEINKPLGQNFVVNEEAYSRINNKGKHITRKFTYDTEDAYELLRQTYKALKEYSEPKVTYEVDADILNFDDIEIGDYVSISDLSFEPPLLISARVSELETSKTNKYSNKAVLSNFNEVRSGISSIFPIPGDNIVSGSIGGEQMNPDYVDSIISDSVSASLVKTKELIADRATIEDLNVVNAEINNLKAKDAVIENLVAEKADIGQLNATNAQIENLKANKADISDLHATNATIGELQANKADIVELNAVKGEINHLKSEVAEIGQIKSDVADIEHILAGNITADNIATGSVTADKIQTGAITAGSGIIADGAIGNAQISSIDAGKISAGKIDTSKVEVTGTDGHLRIKGNRLQVFNGIGNQAKERVSLGDVNGNGSVYGLRVRGADGTTILLDENGVTSEGITDGSITNDKISDNAEIDGAKLNINSVITKINEDGSETINGTKIEVDGTTLNTKLSTITNKQTEDSEKISQAQSQITANTNAIKLKVDEQTYTANKKDMTSKLEKNTSEISAMKGQIALKVEQADIENAKSEMEGTIDTKVNSAKAEIKATTDKISQNVSNLSQTVSNKADGSTVTAINNKVTSLETSVNGISGKVSSLEKTTTTLGGQVSNAQNTADSAVSKANSAQNTANTANNTANSNKTNITNLQGEVSTVKSNIASLEVTTSGISQKVSSVESTTATLTTKVTDAQNTANSAQSTANSANSSATNALNKANSANTLADSKAKVFTTTPTTPYKVGDLWVQGTSGDVMRCKTARSSGSYNSADWEKASKYTDDTKANAVDGKVTTLQGTVNSTNSKVATLETNLNGITQRVSSTESTTATLTTQVTTAQNTANQAKTDASSAISKADSANSNANSAINKANNAQSTADSKAKVFTKTPIVPYKVGDLWVQGTSGDMMKCKTARATGSYTASDWEKASKYTDDTKANAVDGKVTTLQGEYNTTKSKVATLETNLNGITQRVSSTESTTATLTNKVNTVENTANNASNKIDKLQVGVRNYLPNTDFSNSNNLSKWSASTPSTNSFNVYGNFGSNLDKDSFIKGDYTLRNRYDIATAITNGKTYAVFRTSDIVLEKNTEYTVSFYMYKSGNCGKCHMSIYPILENGSLGTKCGGTPSITEYTGAFEKHTVTFTTNAESNKFSVRFYNYYKDTLTTGYSDVHIYHPMVAKGNKPMDWSVSPEDVQTQIDEHTTQITNTNSKVASIETNLSGITSRVENVETLSVTNFNNLLVNSNIAKGRDGWKYSNASDYYGRSTSTSTKLEDKNYIYLGKKADNTNHIAYMDSEKFLVSPGEKITLGAFGLKKQHTKSISAYLLFTDNTSSIETDNSYNSSYLTLNWTNESIDVWNKKAGTFTVPTGCTRAFVRLRVETNAKTSTDEDNRAFFSSVMVVRGENAVTWSGNTEDSYTYHESRLKSAEQKITDKAITSVVQESQFIKDMDGKISTNKSNISKVEQTANSISSKVSDLSGKYTEIKQTVDGIDLTGKVSFSDLSTAGKTTINGANIDTTNLRVKGELISGQINGVGGIRFAQGAVISSYDSHVAGYKGIQISAPSIKLGDQVAMYYPTMYYDVVGKNNTSSATTTWTMSGAGALTCASASLSKTLSVSGQASIGSVVTNGLNVYGNTSLSGTLYTSGQATVGGILNVKNGAIYGMSNIALSRSPLYIPNFGGNTTMDYIRLGGGFMGVTDNGAFNFITNGASRSIALASGTVYLPQGGGNNVTEHARFGAGIVACPSSGTFHFLTASASPTRIYASNVTSAYSLEPVSKASNRSVFDEINSIKVIDTAEGYRLMDNPVRLINTDETPKAVYTTYNEKTEQEEINIDYTTAISTLWKAVQELKQEVEMLKNKNEGEL